MTSLGQFNIAHVIKTQQHVKRRN